MSWATRRRLIILIVLGGAVAAFLLIVAIATFYETPTCADRKQNQGETGIDCGGSCQYLCTAALEPPTVLFTTAFAPFEDRVSVVALVENKNDAAAAKDVPYRVQVYDEKRTLLQEVRGTIDLPPGATVPVYVAGIATGQQRVAAAFLEIEPTAPRWFTRASDPRVVPQVSNVVHGGAVDAPRITATLNNESVTPLANLRVIVFVSDASGTVIAASQTVVQRVPAQGAAEAAFTWNAPFPAAPAAIRVMPVVPLP